MQGPNASLEGLAAGAYFHGVVGYVHRAFGDDERVPEVERAAIRTLRDKTALEHLRTVADLRFLQATLMKAGIPHLVIKGPTLAESAHGAVELRSYNDLDAVVPADALSDAISALVTAGASALDRNWEMLLREMAGEVHLRLPMGTLLDLHWHLLNERSCRSAFPIDMAGVFARSATVLVDEVEVPTLDPSDGLAYVALHTLLSGGHRLIWLKDLERMTATGRSTVDEVRERARQWNVELVMGTAVTRAIYALGTTEHLRKYARIAEGRLVWRGLTTLTWRLDPAERQDGSGSLGRIVSRATRGTQSASLRELARRGRQHLASRREAAAGDRHSPENPRSYLYDAGGEQARRAFLEAVSREGQRVSG